MAYLILVLSLFLLLVAFFFYKKQQAFYHMFRSKDENKNKSFVQMLINGYLILGILGAISAFFMNRSFALIYIVIVMVFSMIMSFSFAQKIK